MTSLKTSIKTITYLSDIGCLEIQGASLSGLTGVGTAWKGYYANQLLGAGSAYMSSQIEGQDSTASVR